MPSNYPERPRVARPRKKPKQDTYIGRVAARLGKLVERANLSTDAAAAKITAAGYKVRGDTLRTYLRGDRVLPIDMLPAIRKAFGLDSLGDWLPPK